MIRPTDTVGRTARRTTAVAAALLVTATGPAVAHGGTGGMMGGGWGMLGGAMALWGLLWMGLVLAAPLLLIYALLERET